MPTSCPWWGYNSRRPQSGSPLLSLLPSPIRAEWRRHLRDEATCPSPRSKGNQRNGKDVKREALSRGRPPAGTRPFSRLACLPVPPLVGKLVHQPPPSPPFAPRLANCALQSSPLSGYSRLQSRTRKLEFHSLFPISPPFPHPPGRVSEPAWQGQASSLEPDSPFQPSIR